MLVLYVEDDPLVRFPVEDALEAGGFELVVASDGGQAVHELDVHASRFCAVVTDIRLGPGVDGWQVARHARHLQPTMPVVYVTGDSSRSWSEHGVPNSLLLQKPFATAQLLTALSTVLNRTSIG